MDLREDIRQLKTGVGELRKFGLLVGGVFGALGLLFLMRHKAHWPWFVWPGAVLMLGGFFRPRWLNWVYLAWMCAAFLLGFVVAHVILTLLFYLVITPMGLIARLAGKDFLRLKLDQNAASYWMPRERVPAERAQYERQY